MYVFLTYPPSQENKISFYIFSNSYVGFFLVTSLMYMELILSVAYSRGQLDCLPNGLPIAGASQEVRLALLTPFCSAPSEVQSGKTVGHSFGFNDTELDLHHLRDPNITSSIASGESLHLHFSSFFPPTYPSY